jgi:hypothetical protein
MDDVRQWLKEFVRAGFDRARSTLRFQPAVRVALDAGEAAALGLIDEGFSRFSRFKESPVMWQKIVFDLIRKLLEAWLTQEVGPKFGVQPTMQAAGDIDADFRQAIAAVQKEQGAKVAGAAVGHDGGILAHLQEAYAAWQARDWAAVWRCVNDIVGHL